MRDPRAKRAGRGRRVRSFVALTAATAAVAEVVRRLLGGRAERERKESMDEHKRVSRRMIEDVFSGGRLELVDVIVAPEFVGHDPALPEPTRGREGLRTLIESYRSAFPDLHVTVDEQLADGDRVCTRWTARGTHDGVLFGIAATHKQATVGGVTIDRLQAGRIVESRSHWDTLGLMTQLGAIAPPVAATV